MARHEDRNRALAMRKKGMSYSQIKEKLGVSKGSLSLWLRDMPLPEQRLRQLRDHSEQRIEKTRETVRQKKLARMKDVYQRTVREIGAISKRELYVAGFFLYWGEGMKADPYTVMFSNTDPAMIKTFIRWITLLGVKKSDLKVYLHIYADMKPEETIAFWSKELGIKENKFRKPYIKNTQKEKRKNYKGRFGFGTCNVYIRDRDIREKVAAGIVRLREMYGDVAFDGTKAL